MGHLISEWMIREHIWHVQVESNCLDQIQGVKRSFADFLER